MTLAAGDRVELAGIGGKARLPHLLAIGWGSGAFGPAIAFYAFGVLLFRYLTDTAAMSAALVGTLIGLSKIYDALINPVIGLLSDRLEFRMGRRRPWMLAGSILLGLSLVMLFNMPSYWEMTSKVGWVVLGLLLFSTGYSLFSIPWMAMPAEMTTSYHERTRMMAWRVGFSSAGQGAGALGGPILLSVLGVAAAGYGRMGALLGGLCILTMLITVRSTSAAPSLLHESAERPSSLEQLRSALRNRPFLVLTTVMAVLYFGGALQAGSMALFTSRVLKISDAWLGSYYLVVMGAMLAAQPVWLALSGRIGKIRALACALTGQVAGQGFLFFLRPGDPVYLLLAQAAVIGGAGGGVFMLTQSLLPDVIEHDFRRTGLRRAGVFSGAVSLIDTGALALGTFALGLLLAGMGYVSGKGAGESQPYAALLAIRLAATLIPAATAAICIALIGRFRLNELPSPESRAKVGSGR